MLRVTITPWDLALAQLLSALRNQVNRSATVTNGRVGPQSDHQTDMDGMVAEMAFCRAHNYWPDLSIAPRSGSADCIGRDGRRIDIKATRYRNGKLLAVPGKRQEPSDIYVLGVVSDEHVDFIGWASAAELLNDSNLIDLGHGPTYALPQDRLHPMRQK